MLRPCARPAPPRAARLSSPTAAAAAFDNYSPWELYEKYVPDRLIGYCTKDDPCSEVTGLAAAGELLCGSAGAELHRAAAVHVAYCLPLPRINCGVCSTIRQGHRWKPETSLSSCPGDMV